MGDIVKAMDQSILDPHFFLHCLWGYHDFQVHVEPTISHEENTASDVKDPVEH